MAGTGSDRPAISIDGPAAHTRRSHWRCRRCAQYGVGGGAVVERAAENADWSTYDIGIGQEGRHAIWVEWYIGHKFHACLVPQLLESLEAGIESGLPAARKAHQRNACRIDARMFCQNVERTIDVQNQVEPTERCLVAIYIREATCGEAIKGKCRNA